MNYAQAWEVEHSLREMRDVEPLGPVAAFFQPFLIESEKDDKKPLPRVLDIGCGQGTNTLWLASKGFRVCGFDSSPSAVQRLLDVFTRTRGAARVLPSITIADATKPWPYRSGSFDIAIDVRVLENLNEKEALFAYGQVGRVLKRGGCFFCLTASERRPSRYTTVGVARQIGDMVLAEWLKAAGLEIMHISREYEGTLEDWRVVAKKV